MRSNGFGSFEQIIIFSVGREWATKVAQIPGMKPLDRADNQDRAHFEWRRWSMRAGNDEDVVWYLTLALDCDFIIDWKDCIY